MLRKPLQGTADEMVKFCLLAVLVVARIISTLKATKGQERVDVCENSSYQMARPVQSLQIQVHCQICGGKPGSTLCHR